MTSGKNFIEGRLQGMLSLYTFVSTLIVMACYFAVTLLHPRVDLRAEPSWSYWVLYPSLVLAGATLFCLRVNLAGRTRPQLLRPSKNRPLLNSAQHLGAIAITLLVGIVLTKDTYVSRSFLLALFPTLWGGLLLAHYLVFGCGPRILFQGRHKLRTLIIGEVTLHDPLVDWLRSQHQIGLHLTGIFSQRLPDGYQDLDATKYGDTPEEALAAMQPHVVICSDQGLSPSRVTQLREACEKAGSRFVVHLNQLSMLGNAASIYRDHEQTLAIFRHEPLESPLSRILKRMFDLAVSVPVVVLVIPVLMALVALIHRLQSPGPLFYTQLRKGAAGVSFTVLKFRTMHSGHGRDGDQAGAGDARIFPAGHWMRKFSLDEFPQFINVLHGEMSVVGPRPHYVEHDTMFARIDPLYLSRRFVKPGITGLAQVAGFRGQTPTLAKVRERSYTDLEYLENWSLRLDLIILAKTAWQVLHPPKSAL